MRKLELSFLTCLALLVTGEPSFEKLTLQVNTKKLVSVSSDKFLSLDIDPLVIPTSNDVSSNYERSIQMVRALSPAYLRLGGPQSNSYLLDDQNNTEYVFSENNWRRLNQWAEKTGLDVVACISPRLMGNDSQVDLVSLTDRMGFNASWQLGYECQRRCNFSGTDVGRYVKILRDKLNAIPRYSNSIITGPDVLDYHTEEQREYLEKFFTLAGESLTAVTWHPNFTDVDGNEDGVFLFEDRLISDKNDLYNTILKHDVARKPLWIAESKAEARKNQFVGALAWTNRLGNTAKLGIEVLMRQPVDLSKPTPDYWVSVLHKKLVGREVLDARIQTDNRSHVHFYVQCTKASAIYQKGAITIFGINLSPIKMQVNVKGLKINNLHEYVLTPGSDTENRMYSKTVLLNNKPLSLFKETELPVLEPVIYYNENGLSIELSSGGIGFWVVPDQKIRSCMDHKVEKENVIEKILRKELQESQIKGNEKGRKVEDMNILTIDHSKPENTWINVEDDYRGYTPNEFFETTSITNVGMKENSNDYYTNIWQGENILKHWVNQENDKEENAKTKPVANVASDVGEERRIKGNTVNMLMNYYSDSSASKSNQENLEESFRVKTQGSKLEDTSVVSLGKTKLTLPDRRRTMTIPIEEDKMTDLGVLHYSKSIGVPMNVLTYTDSKQSQRTKRKVKDLDMILEKEMIDEDEANSKDCKCRVIRNFNDDSKFITFKVKRRVNKNYKDSTKSDKESVDNYETEHYEETTESGNENVENYETEHYEETTESGNENVDNYETEHYEETTESGNENIDNYETEHYEETTESGNENIENYETEHYEETAESSNEKLENYETEQLEKIDKQLVELIKSEFDEIDDYEVDDTSTMITELSNQLSENLENNLNVYDDELKTNEEKFFRGPSGQTKKTEEEINYNKDLNGVNSTLSQNIASISEKETKTTEVRIISDTSSSKESKDTEIKENEDPTTVIFEREKSLKRIKKQVRNVLSRRKKSENESSKISQMLLTKSMDHSKPKMNFDLKKAEAIEEALLTSSNENLTVVKIENENRKSRATKLKEKRNQHNHRERRELSEMIGSKLRVKEEKISEQYKDKISDTIKGNNVNENKMKREIWEITKNNEDDEYTINLKKYPYVLTYEPINDDMLEKRRQKNQEEKKLNPLAVIISPLKNIREKLIEPKSYLHDKLDGSKSGLIQSLRFPYNISDERKRYDKDQVAFDKVDSIQDSIQEKNPWMFQYQRISNEKLRNAYQSKGKEILSENSKIPILKIPIGYMHNESEETMKSKERSNTRQPDYKIYSIDPSTYKSVVDPELEIHEYSSSESLIYDDDDSTPDFYNLILKPKFDKIILKRLKSNQDRKNSPIIYVSNIKRQKNVQKQTEESKIVNNSTNFKEDDSKSMEEDLTNEDYSIAIIPSSIENVEKIDGISNIGENHENIKNRRTRRDVEKNERTRLKRHNYANFNDDLMLDQFYKNSEIFSKLLRSNLVESKSENSNENSRLPMDASFGKNYRIDEDLSKNTVTLPKDIDLIEKLDQILLDDNKFLHFKPEENESSNSEDDEDDSSEKYLNKLDYVRSLRYTNNMLQRENEIFKNPKSNLKHVYNYIKENDNDKSWKDINHENLNKKSEILGHFSEFNRLSIPTGENNEDNILKDFSQHDSVMKNNGQRDQPNGSNKSSFLQGAIPKLQEMITEGFDKTQNLTEPLEEFTESIDKKFNGTLPKDDKNNIFQSGTSSMNTENIFQTLIMNVKKFFAFLFDFNRIKFD